MEANQSNAGVVACLIVPEVLKEDNYERWCIFMEHYLVAQDLWDVVLSIEMPQAEDPRDWVKKNALALHAIKISCGPKNFDQIKKMNSAKDAWNALAELHKRCPNEDTSRESETNTEVNEACARILASNKRSEIVRSLYDGDWDALKKLDGLTEIFFPGGFTILHVATTLGHSEIVQELLKIMGEDYLKIQDSNGDTALSLAACYGQMKIAECLVKKNDKLLTMPNNEGYIPLVVASMNRQKHMTSYLYSKTHFEFLLPENSNQGALLLKYCALNFMLDVGLDLFLRCPSLAAVREFNITISDLSVQPSLFRSGIFPITFLDYLWYLSLPVVKLPSPSDNAVSTTIFKIQVAGVRAMDGLLRFLFFLRHTPGKLRHFYDLKLTHAYAKLVLRHWCNEISTYRDATQLVESGAISAIFQAIKDGTSEIVVEILKANPDLIWCNEKLSRDILISAIKYRQEEILKHGDDLGAAKKALLSFSDKDRNNPLHLVAKLPDRPIGVHAAWTMIFEENLFQEIKKRLPCWFHEAKNLDGETPDEVFDREHQELIKEMEEWAKKTAKSYSVAAVLIVTIMFAALFTVPGGNDQKTGIPILLHRKLFFSFLICDALSFVAATTSLLGFLSILTVTYKGRIPRRLLPSKMLFAISTLTISIAAMVLAFIFALTMMLENKWQVLPAIIVYLLVVFIVPFSDWLIPSLLNHLFMFVSRPRPF